MHRPLSELIDTVEARKAGVGQLLDLATGRSYSRAVPTASGAEQLMGPMGPIQSGTRRLLWNGLLDRTDFKERINRLRVGVIMKMTIDKFPVDPFDDALSSFNKKAKKFRKSI